MRRWLSYPRAEGTYSRQAHCDLPSGTYEREMGKEGFFGPTAHFHHANPPTGWVKFEGPLQPHAFDTVELPPSGSSPWDAHGLFGNGDTHIRYWKVDAPMDHLVRNADGDELLFIHEGEGALFCDWGHLPYRDGDYLLLPRGAMWRLVPSSPTQLLLIEAVNGAYQVPEKGILGPQAIFDPMVLDTPKLDEAFEAQKTTSFDGNGEWRVVLKRRGELSVITYPFNPLDTVGWHGDLMACRLNWRDIRPLMSHRYHLPPSAHSTFIGRNFVVCTFVPRPIESDPGALKVPFYHNNDDYDEILFYHRGNFFSRDNIHPGMLTLHPYGFTHGPHPKAFALSQTAPKKETDEVAVMIDTRFPVDILDGARRVEVKEYVHSWKPKA